ncbi:MAG: carbohydrate binding family 9 domain-containing protein [Chitinophagaceae bacterium]|nr:carbohydrate binding family 9 domain-containing protein [Chitinophagaceae bacterium]
MPIMFAFRCLTFLLSIFLLTPVFGQKKNAGFELHIRRASGPMVIDGFLREPAWQKADRAGDFFMVLPMDTSHANVRTDVRMTYDGHYLYLAAECYNGLPGPDMVESLRRDFAFLKNDNFIFFMDTFEDQTNGFSFGTNAAGGQWDGLMYEGGKVDLSWDNKWISVVRRFEDRWVLEMAIPFKTLRYKKDVTRWGINFSRNDLKTTEKSAWAPVPRQFPTASLAYTGVLVWDAPPPPPGPNISIIPYVLGGASKDYVSHGPVVYKKEIGGDMKVAVTSSLNLDLTVNPDFSQVDVDKQVTDLSRFELFYPEKRQFFLENGDHFTNFGYSSIRPFFSRRIGLGVPIQFGGRLSGKLDRNWRIGVMDMQTGSVDSIGLPQQNFAVVALQRKIFARSNIGILFINKQSLHYQPGKDTTHPAYSLYNRNLGLEFNLASSNNYWTGKALLIKSFSPGRRGDDYVHAGNLQYTNRHWVIGAQYEYTGSNFNAEVGYVPRQGYFKWNPTVSYLFFPRGGAILSHGPQVVSNYYYNESFHHTDDETIFTWLATFRNKSTLSGVLVHDFVELLTPFDPTNTGRAFLVKGSRHDWKTAGFDYVSKPQALLTYDASFRYGGYYADGVKLTLSGDVGYRIQPYVNMTMNFSYNRLSLPQPWGVQAFWLVGPRIDVTMTNTFFFTTYIQYNQQIHNMNLNTRLQWRYKPASDLFLVYTDNYLSTPFSVRSRALVLKFNYWWNL